MSEQTKLAAYQRTELAHMREEQGKRVHIFHFPDSRVCVGVEVLGNFAHVATAYASPSEKKYRRKMGEFIVRERLENGQALSVPFKAVSSTLDWPGDTAAERAAALANSIGAHLYFGFN